MTESQEETKLSGCILAVCRNLVGPGLLLGLGAGLLFNRPRIGSPLDICYLVVFVLLVAVSVFYRKHAEPEKGGNAGGLSKSVYLLIIVGVGSVIWLLTHFVLRGA